MKMKWWMIPSGLLVFVAMVFVSALIFRFVDDRIRADDYPSNSMSRAMPKIMSRIYNEPTKESDPELLKAKMRMLNKIYPDAGITEDMTMEQAGRKLEIWASNQPWPPKLN